MRFVETRLQGVVLVKAVSASDERGSFTRTFERDLFLQHGLDPHVEQCSVSYNTHGLTLRGLHHQTGEAAETKLVRCTRGRVFDVAVDLRPSSRTYRQWFGTTLTAESGDALYLPRGCAHGFLTLCDGAEVFYQIGAPYRPEFAAGVRWDDPMIGIEWPGAPRVISARDAQYPLLDLT